MSSRTAWQEQDHAGHGDEPIVLLDTGGPPMAIGYGEQPTAPCPTSLGGRLAEILVQRAAPGNQNTGWLWKVG